MKFSRYCSDIKTVLLVCATGGLLFPALLVFFGVDVAELVLLWILFIITTFFTVLVDYWSKRNRVQYLLTTLDALVM